MSEVYLIYCCLLLCVCIGMCIGMPVVFITKHAYMSIKTSKDVTMANWMQQKDSSCHHIGTYYIRLYPTHIYAYSCVWVSMFIYGVQILIHIYVSIYIHLYIHIHTYMYTHTYSYVMNTELFGSSWKLARPLFIPRRHRTGIHF